MAGAAGPIEVIIKAMVREEVEARMKEVKAERLAAVQPRIPPRSAEVEATYVTRKQASEIASYSRRTIDRLMADGKLPGYGPNRDRIKLSELHRMMAETARRECPKGEDTDAVVNAEVDRLLNDD
jgi:hypothetical protein